MNVMKKFIVLLMGLCALTTVVQAVTPRRGRARTTANKTKTNVNKPVAVINLDFRNVLRENVGKKYNTQLMRNLMNSPEFVERCHFEAFKPNVEKLSGDVTSHLMGGREVLMLRFGNMADPGLEQIVFWDETNDNLVRTTLRDSETWTDFLTEKPTDIDQAAAKDMYWATFE